MYLTYDRVIIYPKLFLYNLLDCTILPFNFTSLPRAFVAAQTGTMLLTGLCVIWCGGMLGFWSNRQLGEWLVCIMNMLGIKKAMKLNVNCKLLQRPVWRFMACVLTGVIGGYYYLFGALICFMLGICDIRSGAFWTGIATGHIWHWSSYYHSILF